MSFERCDHCGSVLLWAHDQLVCARRACHDATTDQGGGQTFLAVASDHPPVRRARRASRTSGHAREALATAVANHRSWHRHRDEGDRSPSGHVAEGMRIPSGHELTRTSELTVANGTRVLFGQVALGDRPPKSRAGLRRPPATQASSRIPAAALSVFTRRVPA